MNYHDTDFLLAQVGIELRCLSDEIVHRAGGLRAGKSAARDDKSKPLPAGCGVCFEARLFQKRDDAISQQSGITEIFHRDRPIADPGVVEEICLRAEGEEQVIEFELELNVIESMDAAN